MISHDSYILVTTPASSSIAASLLCCYIIRSFSVSIINFVFCPPFNSFFRSTFKILTNLYLFPLLSLLCLYILQKISSTLNCRSLSSQTTAMWWSKFFAEHHHQAFKHSFADIINLNFFVVDLNIVILVYQIHEFLSIDHRFDDTASKLIRNVVTVIVSRIIKSISKNFTRTWFSDWTLNRSFFRRAIKKLVKVLSHFDFSSQFQSTNVNSERLTSRFNSVSSSSSIIIEKISRNMSIISFFFEMNQNTWNQIQTIIQTSITTLFSQREFSDEFDFQDFSKHDDTNDDDNQFRQFKIAEDIDYFDLDYEDARNAFIVISNRHVFYKNVYVFVNKLKNLTKLLMIDVVERVRQLIFFCFRDEAFIWYFIELNDVVRDMLRDVSLNHWYAFLIKRFKKRISVTLQAMQTKKYIMTNARNDRILKIYVQKILRHVKATKFQFIYNQLMMIWNNLNINFRAQIFEFKFNISLKNFIKSLNEKTNIWQQMTFRRENLIIDVNFNRNFVKNRSSFNSKQCFRQDDRQFGDDFNDYDDYDFRSFVDRYAFQFSSRYIFYQYQNLIYQDY